MTVCVTGRFSPQARGSCSSPLAVCARLLRTAVCLPVHELLVGDEAAAPCLCEAAAKRPGPGPRPQWLPASVCACRPIVGQQGVHLRRGVVCQQRLRDGAGWPGPRCSRCWDEPTSSPGDVCGAQNLQPGPCRLRRRPGSAPHDSNPSAIWLAASRVSCSSHLLSQARPIGLAFGPSQGLIPTDAGTMHPPAHMHVALRRRLACRCRWHMGCVAVPGCLVVGRCSMSSATMLLRVLAAAIDALSVQSELANPPHPMARGGQHPTIVMAGVL